MEVRPAVVGNVGIAEIIGKDEENVGRLGVFLRKYVCRAGGQRKRSHGGVAQQSAPRNHVFIPHEIPNRTPICKADQARDDPLVLRISQSEGFVVSRPSFSRAPCGSRPPEPAGDSVVMLAEAAL